MAIDHRPDLLVRDAPGPEGLDGDRERSGDADPVGHLDSTSGRPAGGHDVLATQRAA